MSLQTIDHFFPFFVFAYGGMMTLVLHFEPLMRLAEERLNPTLLAQIQGHRLLALTSLLVGGLWSLQNLWLGPNL